MLAQIIWHGFTIAEVSCPTKYFREASSIDFRRSVRYGPGCLTTGFLFQMAALGIESPLFRKAGVKPGVALPAATKSR